MTTVSTMDRDKQTIALDALLFHIQILHSSKRVYTFSNDALGLIVNLNERVRKLMSDSDDFFI